MSSDSSDTSAAITPEATSNPMMSLRHPTGTYMAATAAGSSTLGAVTSNKVETLYDKLNHLSEEIAEGIINLKGGRREVVQREIDDLRDASYRERSPEAVYNILLFRKYADIANAIKDGKGPAAVITTPAAPAVNASNYTERMSLIGELPEFVYHPEDESLLKGSFAFNTIIFRLRCVAVALAIIVFSVMSAAPNISDADYKPDDYLSSSCRVGQIKGQFNFRAYQFIIAIGVLCFVQNALLLYYYWLPVSEQSGNKFIPGLSTTLGMCCRDPAKGSEYAARMSLICTRYSKYVECISDAVLLLFHTLGFIISMWILQLPVEFTIDKEKEYYTLSTNYLTLSKWNCLPDGANPTPYVRGSLATLFFLLLVTLVLFLVSFRSLRQKLGPDLSWGMFFPASTAGEDDSSGSNKNDINTLPAAAGDDDEIVEVKL